MSRTTSGSSGDKAAKPASSSKTARSASSSGSVDSARVAKRDEAARAERGPGLFGSIGLFLRQVVAELKKVVTPTRSELFRFTAVVLVFVIIMMLFVTALDLLFGWGASWVFGTGTEVTWPDFGSLFGGTPAPTPPAVPQP